MKGTTCPFGTSVKIRRHQKRPTSRAIEDGAVNSDTGRLGGDSDLEGVLLASEVEEVDGFEGVVGHGYSDMFIKKKICLTVSGVLLLKRYFRASKVIKISRI